MMEFERVLFRAKQGDEKAIEQILEMFRPMLIRNVLIRGVFDEDLYQELAIETLKCIQRFKQLEQWGER